MAAEASLRDEIAPAVATLLDRAGGQLERQARRLETLKARAELQAGRLSRSGGDDEDRHGDGDRHGDTDTDRHRAKDRHKDGRKTGRALDGEAALRAQMVRRKREALQYSVERIEMEVAQRERELRARLEHA